MIRGALAVVLVALNTLIAGIPVTLLGILKLITPTRELRRKVRIAMSKVGDRWTARNNQIFDATINTKWDISGVEGLRAEGHYLILSNHVSWLDIFVIFRAFHRRVAFPRFFLKRELIWFPIVGQACWAMDFPFMRRYTKEYLEKHPEKRGRDLEATKVTCRRYRRIPFAILNFCEGTRFSEAKRREQNSPYQHLLRPRIGGTAFVIAALGEQLDAIVDVTLAYPRDDVSLWDFLTNRIDRIVVRARVLDLPREADVRDWLEQIWRDKDTLLGTVVH